jgi:argininosuccinate lyase
MNEKPPGTSSGSSGGAAKKPKTSRTPKKSPKPWGGRFAQGTDAGVEAFTESVSFDQRLWPYDIRGSMAHVEMLKRQGIISAEEAKKICKGLTAIVEEIEDGTFEFRSELEDVHMNVEAALIEKTGDAGRKVHTARSRNDQVALDLRLFVRHETNEVIKLIKGFQSALLKIAGEHIDTVMPGFTHTQRAQPVTLAHHLMAYVEMLERDRARFTDSLKRTNLSPLGACALAGTSLPTDRAYAAWRLGFDGICHNGMDAVSDRDFVIEFIAASAVLMMHLSRFAEEMVLWSTTEFSFVEISDAFTTGSSIMPQKKNPDVAELVRGKTGRVYGALVNVLTMMKALPLAYNRDMQEDKVPLFDAVDTVKACLGIFTGMASETKFKVERLQKTAGEGFSLATDVAEYLVVKGVPFRQAHEITGRVVKYCMEKAVELDGITLKQYKKLAGDAAGAISEDIFERLTVRASLERKISEGGPAPQSVLKRLAALKKIVEEGI